MIHVEIIKGPYKGTRGEVLRNSAGGWHRVLLTHWSRPALLRGETDPRRLAYHSIASFRPSEVRVIP